uniref:retinol dehydrogenase 12-like n=1 Tax=Styela clava TaxID=7725 RepID=UPI0019397823|nr:retinol dehydrogenase 12-like [Styela clava]
MPATVHRGMVNKNIHMDGKTVLITGANTGIGLATAIDMANRNARVIMACRDMEKGNAAKEKVIQETGSNDVILKELDLASFESIREFAADINENEPKLHVLINNAGVMMCPPMKTKDGFEMQFGVNHLGHFLLTNLLVELLKKSAPSRVVTVSSTAHYKMYGWGKIHWDDLNFEKKYDAQKAYGQSKLMNVLFSRELSKRLHGTAVTTYALEPGVVDTELVRHYGKNENPSLWDKLFNSLNYLPLKFLFRTPEQGAQTQIYCAVAHELNEVSGKYYASCKQTAESWDAQNDEYAKRLWRISEELTGLAEESNSPSHKLLSQKF